MTDTIEPFANARELNLADANLNGPWPSLYRLIDAYERLWKHAHEIEEEARTLAFENERLRESVAIWQQRFGDEQATISRQTVELEQLRTKLTEAQVAVEHDLSKILETIAKTDPDDNSEVAELIRCHLDRWAHWGPSRLHIGLGKV